MSIRTSRALRARRIDKLRRTTGPQRARTIELTHDAVLIDGHPFPWHLGTNIDVHDLGHGAALVRLELFTDRFRADSIPGHATLTWTGHQAV